MESRTRALLVALAIAVLGFGAGFAVAKLRLFPHDLLVAVARRLRPSGEDGGTPPAPRMPTGFWWDTSDGEGPDRDEILRDLDALGYMQSYETAGERAYGVTVHDRERAQPGLNLIVSAHEPAVLLADMEGEVLHQWRFDFKGVPRPPGYEPPPSDFGERYVRRARLLADGELLALFERTGLVKLDRAGELIWGLHGGYHHDFDVTADGTIHALTHEVRVIPRIHETRPTFEDFVTRLSPDGEVLGRVSLLEALERSRYAPLLEKADPDRQDVFHTNTLEILEGEHTHLSPLFAAGNALVSLWGLDTVAIVDLERGEVVWALTGMWHHQHEPVLLEDGNLLVFDNMGHHGMSKVVEVEPFSQRIVWSYEGTPENDFYSALIGSNQRLAGGNTLITESLSGRAFEVTRGGEVVWRWETPYRVGPEGKGVAVLMEVERLSPDLPLDWLE